MTPNRWLRPLARRFTFGPLPPRADGWYVWRLSPLWPRYAYKIVEVAQGTMVDTEPVDSHGIEWRVVECRPYGEFMGPVMLR